MIIKPCQKKEGRRLLFDLSMDVASDITAVWRKPTAQLSCFCKIAAEGGLTRIFRSAAKPQPKYSFKKRRSGERMV
jgi:hypothetical protein